MDITSPSFLRSLRNEASRQADFFATRAPEVSEIWTQIETFAHMALAQKVPLRLILCVQSEKPHNIKACE